MKVWRDEAVSRVGLADDEGTHWLYHSFMNVQVKPETPVQGEKSSAQVDLRTVGEAETHSTWTRQTLCRRIERRQHRKTLRKER